MELSTPLRLLRQALLAPRRTDSFRATVNCFMTSHFVQSYLASPRQQQNKRLLRSGMKVYSQGDEDGIIAEIFRRIGARSYRFVEIGAGNGLENNTLWLLLQGWSGTWIEAQPALVEFISNKFQGPLRDNRLSLIGQAATPASITQLESAGVFADIDLLSLDIDGNDFHIISAMNSLQARLVVVEYNAKFPPPHRFVMPYNENHNWDLTDYFGCSLSGWDALMKEKGYSLVGCNITGANAFFVRNDLVADRFCEPLTPENHYEPARYWLIAGFVSGHPANFGEGHVSDIEVAQP